MNASLRLFTGIGRATLGAFAAVGYAAMLLVEALHFSAWGWRIGQPLRISAVARQMREIGADALPIVGLLGFTVGLMLGIQVHRLAERVRRAVASGVAVAKS